VGIRLRLLGVANLPGSKTFLRVRPTSAAGRTNLVLLRNEVCSRAPLCPTPPLPRRVVFRQQGGLAPASSSRASACPRLALSSRAGQLLREMDERGERAELSDRRQSECCGETVEPPVDGDWSHYRPAEALKARKRYDDGPKAVASGCMPHGGLAAYSPRHPAYVAGTPHQETWADCLTRTFAPTWTRS
jgi:hypothetical protein